VTAASSPDGAVRQCVETLATFFAPGIRAKRDLGNPISRCQQPAGAEAWVLNRNGRS